MATSFIKQRDPSHPPHTGIYTEKHVLMSSTQRGSNVSIVPFYVSLVSLALPFGAGIMDTFKSKLISDLPTCY